MSVVPTTQMNSYLIQKWYMMMKEKLISPETSLLYMKRVIMSSVSMFLHSRQIFSDDDFNDRHIGDFTLKLLSPNSSNSSVVNLIELMKQCCTSLDSGYVEQIRFTILTDESEGCQPVEEFAFKFKSAGEHLIFEFEDGYEESSITAPERTRETTMETFEKIVHFNKNLKSLPKKGKILISLLYHDNITPANYEPEGFKACDYEKVPFLKKVCAVRYGEILTPFHKTSLSIKTTLIDENELFNDECEQNQAKASQSSPASDALSRETIPMEMDEEIASSSGNFNIHCSCGMKIAQDFMLRCHSCFKEQHGVCYGILSEKNGPNYHLCVYCYQLMYPAMTPATDELLFNKQTDPEREVVCLMRQFLLKFATLVYVDCNKLALFSGLSITKIESVLEVMELEKYVTPPNASGIRQVLQEAVLCDGLQKYFSSDFKLNIMEKSVNGRSFISSKSSNDGKYYPSNVRKFTGSQESQQVVPVFDTNQISQTNNGGKSSDDFIPPTKEPVGKKRKGSGGSGKGVKKRKTSASKEVPYKKNKH